MRLDFVNRTDMWHPMHLHGHTFALARRRPARARTPRSCCRRGTLTVYFDADNPGLWMLHCHNVYHGEAGMMTVLGYLR